MSASSHTEGRAVSSADSSSALAALIDDRGHRLAAEVVRRGLRFLVCEVRADVLDGDCDTFERETLTAAFDAWGRGDHEALLVACQNLHWWRGGAL